MKKKKKKGTLVAHFIPEVFKYLCDYCWRKPFICSIQTQTQDLFAKSVGYFTEKREIHFFSGKVIQKSTGAEVIA